MIFILSGKRAINAPKKSGRDDKKMQKSFRGNIIFCKFIPLKFKIMIYNERDIRNHTVRQLAEAVMTAARTAPKAKGRDLVEVAMVTDEDIERLSQATIQLSEESGMKFLLRDAANILEAEAVLVIGIQPENSECGLNCGYCGYKGCAEKPACTPCVMNGVDVGIAIGAACSKITDYRLDSRVMFSIGWAAKRLDILKGADLCFAIPLSSASKNPFFDRKSPRKEQPAAQTSEVQK